MVFTVEQSTKLIKCHDSSDPTDMLKECIGPKFIYFEYFKIFTKKKPLKLWHVSNEESVIGYSVAAGITSCTFQGWF